VSQRFSSLILWSLNDAFSSALSYIASNAWVTLDCESEKTWKGADCDFNTNRGSSVIQWLGYGLDDQGSSPATTSRSALGPTQPPTQWVPEDLSLRVKRPQPGTIHPTLIRLHGAML